MLMKSITVIKVVQTQITPIVIILLKLNVRNREFLNLLKSLPIKKKQQLHNCKPLNPIQDREIKNLCCGISSIVTDRDDFDLLSIWGGSAGPCTTPPPSSELSPPKVVMNCTTPAAGGDFDRDLDEDELENTINNWNYYRINEICWRSQPLRFIRTYGSKYHFSYFLVVW